MDVFPAFLWCFLLLLVSRRAQCQEQEQTTTITQTESLSNETTTQPIATTPAATTCSTARKLNGSCVLRQYCDYGTPAIDYTLYVPKNYNRPCVAGQVCCPPNFVLAAQASNSAQSQDDRFDDE